MLTRDIIIRKTNIKLTLLAVFGVLIVFGANLQASSRQTAVGLAAHADMIIQRCSSLTDPTACYDEEIPRLMNILSMEEAFRVSKLIQEQDTRYQYCHVLGHRLSARETSKDLEAWKHVITRCPSGVCSNGCIHGAFQERFRADTLSHADPENLKKELAGICETKSGGNFTGMEQATCYHALGHLLMYTTNGDIRASTALCRDFVPDYARVCFDGAFMQIFQPLEPEDKALVKNKQPTKEEIPDFCSRFDAQEKGSCWTGAWPLFIEQVQTPEGLVAFCSGLRNEEQALCFESLFYILPVQFRLEEKTITTFCTAMPQHLRGGCFAGAATRFLETDISLSDQSIRFCSLAQTLNAGTECYEKVLRDAKLIFPKNSGPFIDLCSRFPQPWTDGCLISAGNGI